MESELSTAGLIALLDQAKAALTDVAKMLGEYRQLLMAAGFPADDALDLCLDVQRAILFADTEIDR